MTAFSRITAAEQLCNARVAATAPAPSSERQRQSWEERMASASERRKVVRAACPHDCPDTCGMMVTVEDGRAVDVRGDPECQSRFILAARAGWRGRQAQAGRAGGRRRLRPW